MSDLIELVVATAQKPAKTVALRQSNEVAQAILALAGERDAWVEVRRPGTPDTLLLAIDETSVFLGRDQGGGLQQFRRRGSKPSDGSIALNIGGQETEIGREWILDLHSAVQVVTAWLTKAPTTSYGDWELP